MLQPLSLRPHTAGARVSRGRADGLGWRVQSMGWCVGLALVALAAPLCHAGVMGVSPIRVDLDASRRAGAITVTNDDAQPLRAQVRLMRWTQDAQGKDVYTDAEDLVFHPRLMSVEPKSQRLVRLGLRQPATETELAYRLFIEELPPPAEAGAQSAAQVAVRVRFGVPVFLAPATPRVQLEIRQGQLDKGALTLTVSNAGNVHVRLKDIVVSDGKGYTARTEGWYHLAGVSRVYHLPLDTTACKSWDKLVIQLRTEDTTQESSLPVQSSQCGP